MLSNGMDTSAYMRANVESDPRHFACFVAHQVHNEIKSKQEGRPIFETRPYFRLERAGERDVLMREATDEDKRQHPEAWRAYEEKRQQRPSGTPLAVLFPAHPEIVATLEFFKVYTVEQLAKISDTNMQTIGLGGREWHNKAVEFLKAAEGAQGFHALKREIEGLQATITKQTAQIAAMEAHQASKQTAVQDYSANTGRTDPNLLVAMQEQIAALTAKVEQAAEPLPVKRRGWPKGKPRKQPEPEMQENV